MTKKERRTYLLKVWNMIRPKAEREKERKENKIREKEKGERERKKEKLFSPIVKIRKDEKKEKERIRQSVKKKGDERKVKWEKKKKRVKEKEKEQWIELPFFFLWYFYSSPFLLLSREVSRDGSQSRGSGNDTLSPVELKLSSSQKVTVRNDCGSHRCLHLSDLGSPDIGRGKRKWSQMIGGGSLKRK